MVTKGFGGSGWVLYRWGMAKDTASEYGGRPGMVQKVEDGHVLTAYEQLSAVNQEKE